MGQKEFTNLQTKSKLLKPASLHKILGKRTWKLEQIPGSGDPNNVLFYQKGRKMRKLTRSLSFSNELLQNLTLSQEKTQKSSTESLSTSQQIISEDQTKKDKFNRQLNIGRPDMEGIPSPENIEGYLAYDLRKVQIPF